MNEIWDKIENNIEEVGTEALGNCRVKLNTRNNNKTPWFRKYIKEKSEENFEAYSKYKTLNNPESRDANRTIRNKTKELARRPENEL